MVLQLTFLRFRSGDWEVKLPTSQSAKHLHTSSKNITKSRFQSHRPPQNNFKRAPLSCSNGDQPNSDHHDC
ncbi:hypothetical protein KIN20_031525 [Parelaphostrongylus tenuis]|uniref:Uncharacterized protein n=1 Tax=Parelaphostrongylus tenuis TaxID=148309 RepID=A0AAD5WGV3_PARTN|nr:hypothetical protein KIN20_031525 [Parelaphostrongylus tenuis]